MCVARSRCAGAPLACVCVCLGVFAWLPSPRVESAGFEFPLWGVCRRVSSGARSWVRDLVVSVPLLRVSFCPRIVLYTGRGLARVLPGRACGRFSGFNGSCRASGDSSPGVLSTCCRRPVSLGVDLMSACGRLARGLLAACWWLAGGSLATCWQRTRF